MKKPTIGILGLVIAAGAVWFSIVQYGDARAAEALAKARADSLRHAHAEIEEVQLERRRVSASLDSVLNASQEIRDSLDLLYTSTDSSAQRGIQGLEPILATVPVIPDSVLNQIRTTIAALRFQVRLCENRLALCDSDRGLFRQQVAIRDTTETELRELLGEYEVQLGDAIRNRRKPAGLVRWLERGLAGYGAVRFLQSILGGR